MFCLRLQLLSRSCYYTGYESFRVLPSGVVNNVKRFEKSTDTYSLMTLREGVPNIRGQVLLSRQVFYLIR